MGVRIGLGDPRLALRQQFRRAVVQARHAADRLRGQVEAAHLIQHDHLERRGGRALLVEPAHVDSVDVRLPVHYLVDRPLVAVEGEHDRLVRGEQLGELRLGRAVRVDVQREQPHQVDHVHHAHAQVRHVPAQVPGRGHRLHRRDVPRQRPIRPRRHGDCPHVRRPPD